MQYNILTISTEKSLKMCTGLIIKKIFTFESCSI